MSKIKIHPSILRENTSKFSTVSADLENIHWDINRLANQLDWEVRLKGGVESKISQAAELGRSLSQQAKIMSEYLTLCANGFEEADSQGQSSLEKNVSMVSASALTGMIAGGMMSGFIIGNKNIMNKFTNLSWHKNCIWAQSRRLTFEEMREQELEAFKKCNAKSPVSGAIYNSSIQAYGRKQVATDYQTRYYENDDWHVGHAGIDISPPVSFRDANGAFDGAPINSILSGEVSLVENQKGYGNVVYVNTIINEKHYQIRYCHLMEGSVTVKEGEFINNPGTQIAKMGHTGSANMPTHLHMEVRESFNSKPCPNSNYGSKTVNPEIFLNKLGINL